MEGFGSSGKKGVVKPFLCKECGETEPDQFYGKSKITCKKCHSKSTHDRQKEVRRLAREHKGGKCQFCGYNKYEGALQFHHLDPMQKDPKEFKRHKNLEAFLAEVDKCILLCANCHAEEHDRLRRVGRAAEGG